MERAVTDYVLRAYLDELSRLLLSRLRAWTNGLVKLQQLQNKVTDLKKRGLLKKAEVETASDQVLNEVGSVLASSFCCCCCFSLTSLILTVSFPVIFGL